MTDGAYRADGLGFVSGIVDLTDVDLGDAMRLADVDVSACRLQLLEMARNPGLAAVQGTKGDSPGVAEQRHATP